ncbi:hypothetical protein C8R44DRAFT_879058 [Mycena epipterygia]|nr:hypothetical protein C8R44DRAFT_879058 [Mycena epipterygia]
MDSTGPALPSEIWLYIHRLATSDTSPLVSAFTDRFEYAPVADPLKDMQHFLQDAYSFVLVCRLWNSLANEILYENVRVDGRFPILYAALERPGTARLVRSIRLSAIRFDRNYAILALCPQVQALVQPDTPSRRSESAAAVASSQIDTELRLPTFGFLRHVYWTESFLASTLLRSVLRVAPNLKYLFLKPSTNLKADADEALGLPAIPNLERLCFTQFAGSSASYILRLDLQRLTRLNCAPSHLTLDFPTLPSLHTLEIFGSRSIIRFSTIFACCPRLRELCYDVWNAVGEPQGEQSPSPLLCIRLHSAVTVVRDWAPIEQHFGLFLSPEFRRLQRLVMYGSWHRVVADARFSRFRDGLRAQGCQLEFPEGCEL